MNKGNKERDHKQNAWRTVEQFLIAVLWTIRTKPYFER